MITCKNLNLGRIESGRNRKGSGQNRADKFRRDPGWSGFRQMDFIADGREEGDEVELGLVRGLQARLALKNLQTQKQTEQSRLTNQEDAIGIARPGLTKNCLC